MSLTFRSSTLLTASDNEEVDPETPASVTALDFLAALTTSKLRFYMPVELDLLGMSVRLAGTGGHATVEIGTTRAPHKRFVAVKRSRLVLKPLSLPQARGKGAPGPDGGGGLGREFEQFSRELRILSDRQLRRHANIVDILGVCAEEFNRSPILSLVLEYSPLGTLGSFLANNENSLSTGQRIDFILQAGRGLEALHQLKVCHADVKVENTLVFRLGAEKDDQCWQVKISDFGQSVIASRDDPYGRVPCRVGTPLLGAPEIRRGEALHDPCYDIEAALRTDVFSYGLLAWEVMKNGRRFLDPSWFGSGSERLDLDTMEGFLNSIPEDRLLLHALDFAKEVERESATRTRLPALFEGALKNQPRARKSMSQLVEILELDAPPDLAAQHGDTASTDSFASLRELLGDLDQGSIAAWGTGNSLYELIENSLIFGGHHIMNNLPSAVQQRILCELKSLAMAGGSACAHSAMTVSECYSLGFGGSHDMVQVVEWLGTAASMGLQKAGLWYHRVCSAFDFDPKTITNAKEGERIEIHLAHSTGERYLIERIHYHNKSVIEAARQSIMDPLHRPTGYEDGFFPLDGNMSLTVFNTADVDELLPLHMASWFGEDALVIRFLETTDPGVKSALGFNAVHFACLGGHLSVLRILLEHNVPLVAADFRSVTALHLAIFFPPADLALAVSLLLNNGCSLEAVTQGGIKWDAHDLRLHSTPIQWAITGRYRDLVRLLVSHQSNSPQPEWLLGAIGHFYWEILEDLLPYFRGALETYDPLTRLQTIHRPFCHWIAHGRDHVHAIQKTVQLCNDNGLLGFEPDGSSHLEGMLNNANSAGDSALIDAILSVASAGYVKNRAPGRFASGPALAIALHQAGNKQAWRGTIAKMADFYSLEELEDGRACRDGSFLSAAVSSDSVVGARVLLERGVDVNRPYVSVGRLMGVVIHQCLSHQASPEMLSLLVEFGADLLAKDPVLPITPLQWLLSGRLQTDSILGILLQGDQPDQVYIEALHRTFRSQLIELEAIESSSPRSKSQAGKERQYRVDLKEQFRRVLTHPRLVRYVDRTEDEHGATLIQQAAYVLHSSSVRLLLDAGADAGRAFHHGSYSALPLQIACTQARGLYAIKQQLPEGFSESSRRRLGQAMEVAKELLKWHVARGDGVFQGITELHLACRMADEESMVGFLSLGMDSRAKGRWPGVEQEVTPRELLRLDLEADMAVVLNFPVPGEQDDAERPIPQAMDLLSTEFSEEEYDSSSVNTEDLEL